MASLCATTLYLRDGSVIISSEDGGEEELPADVLWGSKLLMESSSIESKLDEHQANADGTCSIDLIAPKQYLEAWLESLAWLHKLQSGAPPDCFSATSTDTLGTYVKVCISQ
jgi:hypothetical protein